MNLVVDRVDPADPRALRSSRHSARLVIPPRDLASQSPFLLMAEDWVRPPAGFPTHPHRGMETVTFVVDGQMLHADHTGASGVLDAGSVEFMTAGAGVMHSELPGEGGVHSLQLWLNLPARLKWTPARYAEIHRAEAPVHRQPGVEARVYAGRVDEAVLSHGSTWPLTLIELTIARGVAFDVPIPGGERVFAYVLEGAAALGASGRAVQAEEVAWARPSDNRTVDILRVVAEQDTRLLIYASPIIDEPIALGGPFVMNTQDEIERAFDDLNAGRLTMSRP